MIKWREQIEIDHGNKNGDYFSKDVLDKCILRDGDEVGPGCFIVQDNSVIEVTAENCICSKTANRFKMFWDTDRFNAVCLQCGQIVTGDTIECRETYSLSS